MRLHGSKFQRATFKVMVKNNITFLLYQKVRAPHVKDGICYYIDKIKPYADIDLIEPKDEKNYKTHLQKLEKETMTIVLDLKGRQFTSESFSKTWQGLTTQKVKDVSFIIGGPFGIPQPVRSDLTLSLSSFTMNHELVPLVIMEQVYRAYSILQGLPYHHA